MLLNNRVDSIAEYDLPTYGIDNDPSILTSIYQDKINIAIWQRQHQPLLDHYATEWSKQYSSRSIQLFLNLETLADQLDKELPDLEYKAVFKQDLVLLVDMFLCLFDGTQVGLRISPLSKAMCPKFHVDNIPCRLITTYGGIGTEWLLEQNLDRSRLGRGANGLPDHESGILQGDQSIQQVSSQHVALLKGSGWQGNEQYGLVHRSPSLTSGQTRLLLTLDLY